MSLATLERRLMQAEHLLDRIVTPVFFTYGDKRTVEGGEIRLGKAWLVGRLQILLQSDRLHLPDTPEARALADKLLDYEIRVDPDGDARFGAFKVGKHDDLVTALGLATQVEPLTGPLVWFVRGDDDWD